MKHIIILTALFLITACSMESIMTGQKQDNLLESIDQNGDRRVSYAEFSNHLSQERGFYSEVQDEFKSCDQNRDSYIVLSEAKNKQCMDGADDQDFRIADGNNDQRVTFKEFHTFMIKHLFAQADNNKDQFLSGSEIRSF